MDLENKVSRRDFIKLAGRVVGGLSLASLFPLSAFAGESEVTSIPKGMKDLGFELVPYEGTNILSVPSFEIPWYSPDIDAVVGVGHFTKIDFDPSKKLVTLETSEGETATLEVNVEKNLVNYRNVFRGQVETKTTTYERDKDVRRWVQQHERNPVPASIHYDSKSGNLIVRKDGVGEIYRERVQLPKGINIDVILGRYLKISDGLGKKFTQSSFIENAESDCILVGLNPSSIQDNRPGFGYTIGSLSSGFEKLQDFIDELMIDSIYKQEFDESSRNIAVGNQRLRVRGPNRNGDYELTSGKSSIIYHPNDQSVTLARAFNTRGATSTIMSGSVPEGEILVKDDYGDRGYQIWKFQINFGNRDPNQSYTATLVKNTAK